MLADFDTEAIDVPLVVGKSVSGVNTALPWEDMMQQCTSKGWEYVDLSDNGEDELGARNTVLSAGLTSPSLDDTSAPTFPSSDYPPFDDAGEEDPTAHLADMFASFAGLKELALNMQDSNQKMDFAEEISRKFAEQLDLLMRDEMNDLQTTQPREVRQQKLAVTKNKASAGTDDTTDESTVSGHRPLEDAVHPSGISGASSEKK